MLLAMPGMEDENFNHAAIALCVHDEQGALGLDLGREMEGVFLSDLMEGVGIEVEGLEQVPVMSGGPVEPQRGFVLHSRDWSGQDSVMVGADWALSGSLDILKAIAGHSGPERYIVALGYSGWGAGQLEYEMTRHGWFLGKEIPASLHGVTPRQRWTHCFADCGIDARLLAGKPGQA